MAMDEKGLGKRLQEARQAAGLTQQQLCHKANLSFSTLTKIERGAIKSPSIFTIQAIATALNLSLDELVGQSSAKPVRDLKKTKNGASFVFFDVNGCLVLHLYQQAFTALARDVGTSPDAVESIYWHYNDEVCRGTLSMSDFNQTLAERLGVKQVVWQDYYLQSIEPVRQMQEMMVWASEHYKIGLLTNIMPGFLTAMRRSGQMPDVQYDVVIDSSEVGFIKPEVDIYKIAMERAGVPADEILLIDDTRANIMAAEKLGWHVLWFDDTRPKEMAERVRSSLEPA